MIQQSIVVPGSYNHGYIHQLPLTKHAFPAYPETPPRRTIDSGVLSAIGYTPLICLNQYIDDRVQLHVKLEALNPGGSAKDRPAALMITEALNAGQISQNTTIIESSSGNMGVGLAQVCGYYGLSLICVVDSKAQPQNVQIMEALGAHIVRVDDPEDGDFLGKRLERVQSLVRAIPDSYWPNQYANELNPKSHQTGTIKEIIQEMSVVPDYLFVATSSTGTAQGCQNYLKQHKLPTQVVAVDAVGSVLFGGSHGPRRIPGLGTGCIPPLADGQSFSHVKRVNDLDCVVGCRRMASREAMLVGGSAGGVMEAIYSMRSELRGKSCVAILHDSGTRYLDTVYSDDWVESTLGCNLEDLKQRVGRRKQRKRNRYFVTGVPRLKSKSKFLEHNHSLTVEESKQILS
ncbi:putative siderophore biosynthesis protein SbnA [Polystyrenella longa]|uniref:N-(2-amino-2-carboxyethyl)-L-glutamate synthase n=1 Tax=Polystyrenella longa TaxID=2528007 RepID=A0A518CLE1_9PLAN|nr:2,3-diaminopropionate biosynthesis protein SbnA [Polystyrenella longa]QDU80045.1 putative siderophore biosynthesis protein SbnA [Polystyrenella longa]